MDVSFFRAWIEEIAREVEAHRDHLTHLDRAIGDADHGTNLARGFAAVLAAMEADEPKTPGALLTLVGTTLIAKVGGASGPLYGTAFRRAGKVLGEAEDVTPAELGEALSAALGGVQNLGAAAVGDKTMVDALAPAVASYGAAISNGSAPAEAFVAAAAAAERGAIDTIPLQARKGRASYLGPRSVGHEDPGAASTVLILGALRRVGTRGSQQ